MDRIRHKFDVRVSAPTTGVLTEGFFKCKPLEQQAQVVNRSVVCRLHMARTLLDVTVVSEKKFNKSNSLSLNLQNQSANYKRRFQTSPETEFSLHEVFASKINDF